MIRYQNENRDLQTELATAIKEWDMARNEIIELILHIKKLENRKPEVIRDIESRLDELLEITKGD